MDPGLGGHVSSPVLPSGTLHNAHVFIDNLRAGVRLRTAVRLEGEMIYILAALFPPLGLLLNGQPFSALFNLALILPCFFFGWFFPILFLVPSLHGIIAVHMRREDRRHREIVAAIERHGAPPWYYR
jgi:hypothetical protein